MSGEAKTSTRRSYVHRGSDAGRSVDGSLGGNVSWAGQFCGCPYAVGIEQPVERAPECEDAIQVDGRVGRIGQLVVLVEVCRPDAGETGQPPYVIRSMYIEATECLVRAAHESRVKPV